MSKEQNCIKFLEGRGHCWYKTGVAVEQNVKYSPCRLYTIRLMQRDRDCSAITCLKSQSRGDTRGCSPMLRRQIHGGWGSLGEGVCLQFYCQLDEGKQHSSVERALVSGTSLAVQWLRLYAQCREHGFNSCLGK